MNNNPPGTEPVTKRTNGGTAICFSACEDSQLAADTAVRIVFLICFFNALDILVHFLLFLSCDQPVQAFGGKEMNGVMTYLLAKIIREHSGITYASLLEKLHEDIAKIQRSKHFSGFLKRIFHRRIDQVGLHHTLYTLFLLRSIYIQCHLYFIPKYASSVDTGEETSYISCLFEEASIPLFCFSSLNISIL
jgi:hypothetical protein